MGRHVQSSNCSVRNFRSGVSNLRPGGQNRPGKDSKQAHLMVLENMKDGFGKHEGWLKLWTIICILISFTLFPTDKDLPQCHSYYTKVKVRKVRKVRKVNQINRKVPVFIYNRNFWVFLQWVHSNRNISPFQFFLNDKLLKLHFFF